MNVLRQIFSLLAPVLVGAILGAAIYESVVLVPNFRYDPPNSLEHFHQFMHQANPGTFFRVMAPAAQVALLVCAVIFWKFRPARWGYLLALAALITADVVTFRFHYPRNHLLFDAPLTQSLPALTAAAQEWGIGNIGRVLLLATSALGAAWGLRKALFAPAVAKAP